MRVCLPLARESVRKLDLIVLRRARIDDDYGVFGEDAPAVVELSAVPERQLFDLLRLTAAGR